MNFSLFATSWAESPITQLVVDQLLESGAPEAPQTSPAVKYPAIAIHKAAKRAEAATLMAEYLSTLTTEDPLTTASVGVAAYAWDEVDQIVEKWTLHQ
jgi:hypothetical protein